MSMTGTNCTLPTVDVDRATSEANHTVLCVARIIAHQVAGDCHAAVPLPPAEDAGFAEARYWLAYEAAQARALEAAMGELRPVEPALAAAIAAAYAAARRVV